MKNESEFLSEAHRFLEMVSIEMKNHSVELPRHWDIDHLCYRVSTQENYLEKKDFFLGFADLLIESEVNGRMISSFELHRPLYWKDWRIDLLELPAPKNSKKHRDGFEHFEVVCDLPFDELQNQWRSLPWDTQGLKKDFNQELEITWGGYNLKFHHLSLKSVIHLEKKKNLYKALKNSEILSRFADCHPRVAGTFLLGIETRESDLDLLMEARDLKSLNLRLKESYGTQASFFSEELKVDGLDSLIVRFEWENIPFEVFAQNKPSVQQKAYLHFLAEEKLLKWGGKTLLHSIQDLRKKGVKTEPAFAKVFSVSMDPYEWMLEVQKSFALSHFQKHGSFKNS